jgi:hypothetical protein
LRLVDEIVHSHAVPAGRFSAVQSGVGMGKYFPGRNFAWRRNGSAYANRGEDLRSGDLNWASADCGSNSFGGLLNFVAIAPRKHNQKLFSAIAAHNIVGAHSLSDAPHNFFQDAIATQVAAGVINVLKAIEVEHQNAGRSLATSGPLKFTAEHIQGGSPTPNAGQSIVRRLEAELPMERQHALSNPKSSAKFIRIERLGQVIVRARLESVHNFPLFVVRGD